MDYIRVYDTFFLRNSGRPFFILLWVTLSINDFKKYGNDKRT